MAQTSCSLDPRPHPPWEVWFGILWEIWGGGTLADSAVLFSSLPMYQKSSMWLFHMTWQCFTVECSCDNWITYIGAWARPRNNLFTWHATMLILEHSTWQFYVHILVGNIKKLFKVYHTIILTESAFWDRDYQTYVECTYTSFLGLHFLKEAIPWVQNLYLQWDVSMLGFFRYQE